MSLSHTLHKISEVGFTASRTAWGKGLLLCAFFFYLLSESGYFAPQGSYRNDLDIFLQASIDLFRGENIYVKSYFDGYHYYYSTLFATLLRPLAALPSWLSKLLWLCMNAVLLIRVLQLTACYLGDLLKSDRQRFWFSVLLLFISFRFIKGNLHLGQVTLLMLALSLEGIYRIHLRRQYFMGGLLLAVAINVKLLPVVLLPYLLYRAQWKAFAYAVVMIAFLYTLPACWLGWQQHQLLLAEWWALINPAQHRHVLDMDETSFHSLSTLLAALFTDYVDPRYGLQSPRHITVISIEQLEYILLGVRLFFVALTLWFLRTLPFRSFGDKHKTWWELSYLLAVIPLIFPHQQHYAFLMMMPALAWIAIRLFNVNSMSRLQWVVLLTAFMVVVTVFNLSLWLGAFTAWYNHYKVLTYGALLLVLLLAILPSAGHQVSKRKE